MSRKRIVWCQDANGAVEALTMLYFGAARHRLVRLRPTKKRAATTRPPMVANTEMTNSPNQSLASPQRGRESDFRELRREARFSDLLIMADTYYRTLARRSGGVRSVSVPCFACPVLVVPEAEERIEQLLLIDDGEPATHRQIKQIACLFAELCSVIPTTLLKVRHNMRSAREEKLWVEYLKIHFTGLAVHYQTDDILPSTLDLPKSVLTIGTFSGISLSTDVLRSLKQSRLIL